MNNTLQHRFIHPDDRPLFLLSMISLGIHLWANLFDGIFIDELYYVACSKHLDFGYVDHPPFVALIGALTRLLFGESLFALRIPAVLTSASIVFLTGRLARQLGGNRSAQMLASLAALICPTYLGIGSYFSMNVFDHLFWLLAFYTLVRIIQTNRPGDWIGLGIILGLGLQNKISVLFLGFGLGIGILLTPHRRWLFSKWVWISGAIASFIFLPHILWQIAYDWPTLEFIRNATLYKNQPMTPGQFLFAQFLDIHPILFPIWVIGLYWCLFSQAGKPYRIFGWIYLAVFILFLLKNGKPYYLAPAYTILFATGAICIESWIQVWKMNWIRPALAGILILFGMITLPLAVPLLPTEMYIRYSQSLGIQPTSGEKKEIGPLPQFFADRFGWEELAAAVATVYRQLSPAEQGECVIIGGSYGYAGAIDYFGPKYDLPNAISPHNSYYFWGPGEKAGNIAVVFGFGKADLEKIFSEVQEMVIFDHPYKMPYQRHMSIYLCKNLKQSISEIWANAHHFI